MEKNTNHLKPRILAYSIDYFLILIFIAIGFVPIVIFIFFVGFSSFIVRPTLLIYFQISLFVFPLGYFFILEVFASTTLGKKICDLKIIVETGSRMTYKQSFIRNLSKVRPELIIIDLLVGYLINPSKDQRALEILSKTSVTKADALRKFTAREQSTFNIFRIVLSILGVLFLLFIILGTWLSLLIMPFET